jgi:hypothetical protein
MRDLLQCHPMAALKPSGRIPLAGDPAAMGTNPHTAQNTHLSLPPHRYGRATAMELRSGSGFEDSTNCNTP